MNISKTFRAQGHIFGFLWAGGVASCPTSYGVFRAGSLEELRAAIQAAIESGSIDQFGFESLIGAVMLITTVSAVEIEGKNYMREDSEIEIFFHSRIIPCDHEKWTETFRQIIEAEEA